MKRILPTVWIVGTLIVISSWLLGRSSHRGIPQTAATQHQRIIYATNLSAPADYQNYTVSEFHTSEDPYSDATRILTYQILHAPDTRTKLGIEFVFSSTKMWSKTKELSYNQRTLK
jgi:alpha-N-acetylglucosamine transferase